MKKQFLITMILIVNSSIVFGKNTCGPEAYGNLYGGSAESNARSLFNESFPSSEYRVSNLVYTRIQSFKSAKSFGWATAESGMMCGDVEQIDLAAELPELPNYKIIENCRYKDPENKGTFARIQIYEQTDSRGRWSSSKARYIRITKTIDNEELTNKVSKVRPSNYGTSMRWYSEARNRYKLHTEIDNESGELTILETNDRNLTDEMNFVCD